MLRPGYRLFGDPSWSARAYAKALSKPWPLVGSPSSHGAVLWPSAFGSKYGGKAGLSVPIVSVPAVSVARLAAAHSSADGAADGDVDAAAVDADGATDAGAGEALEPALVQAVAKTARETDGDDRGLAHGSLPQAVGTRESVQARSQDVRPSR